MNSIQRLTAVSDGQDICFEKVDKPLEAFLAPANDMIIFLKGKSLEVGKFQVKETFGEESGIYTMEVENESIKFKGKMGDAEIEVKVEGYDPSINFTGKIGSSEEDITFNSMCSSCKGKIGDFEIKQKYGINPSTKDVEIIGEIKKEGDREGIKFREVFHLFNDQPIKILGNFGQDQIIGEMKQREDGSWIISRNFGNIPTTLTISSQT